MRSVCFFIFENSLASHWVYWRWNLSFVYVLCEVSPGEHPFPAARLSWHLLAWWILVQFSGVNLALQLRGSRTEIDTNPFALSKMILEAKRMMKYFLKFSINVPRKSLWTDYTFSERSLGIELRSVCWETLIPLPGGSDLLRGTVRW